MESLLDRIRRGMTDDEKYDVLLSLTIAAGQGRTLASPEEILTDDELRLTLPGEPGNLICLAPEYVGAVVEGAVPETGPRQSMFTLGILCYSLFFGEDYYRKAGFSVTELDRLPAGRTTVIAPEDVRSLPFGSAVSRLTSLDPGKREGGLNALLRYFTEKVPGTAVLSYREDGREIKRIERVIRADIDDLHPTGLYRIGPQDYRVLGGPVAIPYRPGKHLYPIRVQKAAAPISEGTRASEPAGKDPAPGKTGGRTPAPGKTGAVAVREDGSAFRQAALSGRWLYADRSLLPDAFGGDPWVRILSLNWKDADCELSLEGAAKGPELEFPVVQASRGALPLVEKRLCVTPGKTAKLCFAYRAAEDAVEVRLLDGTGLCRTSRTVSLKGEDS